MGAFLLRRFAMLLPVLLGVLTCVFLLIHLIPGDPVEIMLGENALAVDREALRDRLHLNDSMGTQYLHFLAGVVQGDLGASLHSGRPVGALLLERIPATLTLTLAALLVAAVLAIPLGLISAVRAGTAVDHGAMMAALLGVSMPNFWLGPLLILLFSVQLDWLPLGGRDGPLSYLLPAITLGTAMAAILTRMVRASVLEVLDQDFVRTARAKGASELRVVGRHVLANAMIPVVTVIGLQFGALLAGSIITETVFSWPGLGRLTIEAIQTRDYPVVQGCVLVICIGYLLATLLTDLCYALVDPRVRIQ